MRISKRKAAKKETKLIKPSRRDFLKLLALSGGLIFLAKLFGSDLFSGFGSKLSLEKLKQAERSGEFRVGESFTIKGKYGKLIFYNKAGRRIFSIDQDGTMEIG